MLAGGGVGGREKGALGGAGRQRMELRNLAGRGGQSWAESCLGTKGREGTLQAQEATRWSVARKIMGQQEPALMN